MYPTISSPGTGKQQLAICVSIFFVCPTIISLSLLLMTIFSGFFSSWTESLFSDFIIVLGEYLLFPIFR